jgi:DNA (cytosine-5)-methyltransferase 1
MGIHPTVLSLFTGYGGLEMGLHRALGGTRTVCMVEREAFAIANLVAQMEAGALAPAPIWTDVSTFDGKPWRDRVDILCGGPPCQPFSTAGKRRHTDDERWIWSDVARIVGEVRPGVVFFENVPGLRKRGLGVMLRDLAALGYDAEWGSFTASEAGAPHRRTRLFLLAYADREQLRELRRGRSGQGGASAAQPQLAGAEVADASGLGLSKLRTTHDEHRGDAPGHQPDGCDAFPPGPDDADGWRRWLGSGGAQPGVRGGAHAGGCKNRVHRIRLLGNGVVPVQAELAFRELSARVLDSV